MVNKKRIDEMLKNIDENAIDQFVDIYNDCIVKTKDTNAFQYLLEQSQEYDFSEKDRSLYFSREKVLDLFAQYADLLSSIVSVIARKELIESEFYSELYKAVFESELFSLDDREKGVLLFFLAEKIMGIPYYKSINPLVVSSEEIQNSIERITKELKRAAYVINARNYRSRTETASQIYETLLMIPDRTDRIVFLSAVMIELEDHEEDKE